MVATGSFVGLMAGLRHGGDDAARAVFERFVGRLTALARRRLGGPVAARVDPEDVVQSAFKSFFVRQRAGGTEAGDWSGVWGLLAVITLRKCADRVQYHRAARRDVGRETRGDGGAPDALVADREPRPDEAAALAETVEALLRAAGEDERPVLELSLQGYSALETSARLGRALRSVHRIRGRIRQRLEQLAAAD